MNDQIAIHVEHVQKEFRIYLDKGIYLKERFLFKKRRRYEERKVLKDISFDVHKGRQSGLLERMAAAKAPRSSFYPVSCIRMRERWKSMAGYPL